MRDCQPCLALPVGLTVSPGLGDSMGHSSWCWARCGALLCAAVSEALRAAGGRPGLADVTPIPGSVSGSVGSAGLRAGKGSRCCRAVAAAGCSAGCALQAGLQLGFPSENLFLKVKRHKAGR